MTSITPTELLQKLIRFDTTNPPGNEAACIGYIKELLDAAGFSTQLVARDPNRPNLIARLPGAGQASTLLFQGHVDVVTTANQNWSRDPFGGEEADGFIWGRGALDMKGGVAMMLAAALRAAEEKTPLAGDLLLAILADEEAAGHFGAGHLVAEHPDLFEGVRYSIGELGGFTLSLAGRRFYPIQIAEKQSCWIRVTFRGDAGHAAMPLRGGAMAKLGRFLLALDSGNLPVHVTPSAQLMIEGMAAALPAPVDKLLLALLDPATTDYAISQLGPLARVFGPMVRNTASPTIVHGGEQINVIPSQVQLQIDARLLPGFTPDMFLDELRAIAGDEGQIEVLGHDPYPGGLDMGLYDTLAAIIREVDPEGVPVPYMQVAVTDARYFARLGIQNYGFTPMTLPADFDFVATLHAPDERIPVGAVEFGADAIYRLLQRGWD